MICLQESWSRNPQVLQHLPGWPLGEPKLSQMYLVGIRRTEVINDEGHRYYFPVIHVRDD